jgi:glycosyltransferase involved in cell wall biosynthesis
MGYVFTSGDIKARLLRPLLKGLMRWTLASRQSLLILQNPDDVEDFVSAKMVPKERVRLILGSGVDTVRFCPNDRLMPLRSRLRVLLAARLLWEKGIQEFVDAAILLRAQGRDVEFLLAGMPDAGNPRSVGRAQVQKWADSGLITWLGHVDDMPKLLQSVNVMALPSYYREGVPKSLIEGAASGLALITTDRPGCREVVRNNGIDGLLVEPRNGAQLAELIAQLDDDRVLLQALGKKARQNSLAYFDERQVIRRTMGVYAELLPAFEHE